MELKQPKSKGRDNFDSQPAFPIFIQSEIGLPIENWVPVVCNGVHRGMSVIVSSPAEISALYSMGDFGKGSSSRSKPYIVRSNPEQPRFMRQRQYAERTKWTKLNSPNINSRKNKREIENDSSTVIDELHSIFAEMLKNNIIKKKPASDDKSLALDKSNEVIDLLSSDEEIIVQNRDIPQSSRNNERTGESKTSETEVNADEIKFQQRSVVVLPDSNSDEEDYFKNLKPKLCIDESKLCENLVLTLEEAYFLSYGLGCLQIVSGTRKMLSLENIWNLFCESQANFPISYTVYHYFRSKGWIVKPGIKFGGNFLLYKRGQSFYHASYIVVIHWRNESDNKQSELHDWVSYQNLVRLSTTAAKEVLIANVILPDGMAVNDMKESSEVIKKVSICETLLRRWTPGQKKDDEPW